MTPSWRCFNSQFVGVSFRTLTSLRGRIRFQRPWPQDLFSGLLPSCLTHSHFSNLPGNHSLPFSPALVLALSQGLNELWEGCPPLNDGNEATLDLSFSPASGSQALLVLGVRCTGVWHYVNLLHYYSFPIFLSLSRLVDISNSWLSHQRVTKMRCEVSSKLLA